MSLYPSVDVLCPVSFPGNQSLSLDGLCLDEFHTRGLTVVVVVYLRIMFTSQSPGGGLDDSALDGKLF